MKNSNFKIAIATISNKDTENRNGCVFSIAIKKGVPLQFIGYSAGENYVFKYDGAVTLSTPAAGNQDIIEEVNILYLN